MYIFTKTSVWPLYDSTRTDWVIKALVKQSLTRHTVLRSRHFTKRWTPKRYLERLTSHRIDDATSYAIDEYTWALITSFVIFRRNYLSLKIYGTPLKQFRRPGSGLATSCQSRCLPLSFISRVNILASLWVRHHVKIILRESERGCLELEIPCSVHKFLE